MSHAEDCATNIHSCYMICYQIHSDCLVPIIPAAFLEWAIGTSELRSGEICEEDWNIVHGKYLYFDWREAMFFPSSSQMDQMIRHWKGWPENEMCYNELIEYQRLQDGSTV